MLEDCSCITKRFQHKYFLVNIVKFLQTPILKNICERLLLYICWPLLNRKHNMEWFLLRMFVDLVRTYFLLIVSRNHSNRVNIVLISGFWQIYAGCYQLHNVYFNDMQINRWRNFKDKGHLFTLNLRMTTKICRISLLRTFFLFLWINLFCSIADVV